MIHDHAERTHNGVRKIGFSDKIWRCLERSERRNLSLRTGTPQEISSILDVARETMELAPQSVIDAILLRAPSTIQVAEDDSNPGAAKGLTAVLPLNGLGLAALLDGHFTGPNPNPDWLSAAGQQPEAVYVWLIYMPGSFGRLLAMFASALEPYLLTPVPIFSKATNPHSARLQKSSGFVSAADFYPSCANGMLVVFPEASINQLPKPEIEIKLARTVEDIFQVFSVRSATYLAEQFCLYNEEFDGNDFCSTHFLGKIDGDAAGCVRLRFFAGFAKLERLAVRVEYRQSKLAYQLVRVALDHCKKKGFSKVLGHSRLDLVRFWRVFGFHQIPDRPIFSFANVKYAEILLQQESCPDQIDWQVDPMVIIRPEGAWDRPGPFDQSAGRFDLRRKTLIANHTRTVGRQHIVA
jgi:predicted GNAT family N-acyltransferase